MKPNPTRREFVASLAGCSTLAVLSCNQAKPKAGLESPPMGTFFFVSQGKTAMMNAAGTGLRVLDFSEPNQVTWQPAGFFPDGRRVLFLSMEARRDGPGRPFSEYYTQTPTHIWIYDLDDKTLTEIATKQRMAVFYAPQLLLGDGRMLVQVVRKKVKQVFSMNLDGSDAREFTGAGEGLPYGFDLNPETKRVVFHLASPSGYQVWTSDFEGQQRSLVAARQDHLYFGPCWSPEGDWIAYQDCHARQDPGHDWSDVCVSRPDGSEQRILTRNQPHWFGASYGSPERRGSGSNMLRWTRAGSILFSRKLPGSKPAWEFQSRRPDTDHFNRDYRPELAHGGTEICQIDPRSAEVQRLTQTDPPVWDFRATESPDGRTILFCRAETSRMPGLWLREGNSSKPRHLTDGLDDQGADHPYWVLNGARSFIS